MSAPPPEQPVYYSPAPAPGGVVDPSQQQYQYVTPQQPGTPYQQHPSPDQIHHQPDSTLTQPYYAAASPAQVPQPVYNDAQSPMPQHVYAQPTGYEIKQDGNVMQQQQPVYAAQPGFIDPNQQQHQQAYFAQQQQQGFSPQIQQQPSTFVVTTEHTATDVPVVSGNGRGLTGKMQQVSQCCFCLPLHTGALIIAAIMTIYYAYCGIVLFAAIGILYGAYVSYIFFGIAYLAVAAVSGYGFMGIYKESPPWVDRFIRMFVIGSIVWFVIQIIDMIVVATTDYITFFWAGYIIELVLASALQYYFCVCLVSYQRVLHARVGDAEKF